MDLESKRLYKLVDDTVALTGQKNDRVAVAQTLAVQLEQFVEHNERITQSFSNFKDNITSLGTAMQNMAESKLDIDQIFITGVDAKAEIPMIISSPPSSMKSGPVLPPIKWITTPWAISMMRMQRM